MPSELPGGNGTPGGMPPTPPPLPVRRSANNGCLLWGLAGCGGLLILGVAFLAYVWWSVSKNEGAQKLFRGVVTAPACGQSLGQVRVALEDYRRTHKGQYPSNLTELVPKYMHPQVMDACGGSVDQLASRTHYTPPKANAPADAPVVSIHMSDSSLVPTQTQTLYVRLLKDGRVVLDQVARTELVRPDRPDTGSAE